MAEHTVRELFIADRFMVCNDFKIDVAWYTS